MKKKSRPHIQAAIFWQALCTCTCMCAWILDNFTLPLKLKALQPKCSAIFDIWWKNIMAKLEGLANVFWEISKNPFLKHDRFYFGIWSLWAVDQGSKHASWTAKLNLSYSHLTLHHFVCTCISTPISGSSFMFGGYCWLHCWHWRSLKFQASRTAPHISQQICDCIVAGMRREYPVLYCPPQDLIGFWLVLTGSDWFWSDLIRF